MFIVPGRPKAQSLTWWVLTDGKPTSLHEFAVSLSPQGSDVRFVPIAAPGEGALFLVATRGLAPDTEYSLTAALDAEKGFAVSRTLPASTPAKAPFTFAVGSCFSIATYRREYDLGYPPPEHQPRAADPIRFRLLLGDQIYMDLDHVDSQHFEVNQPDPWKKYREQWRNQDFQRFLMRSPNLMLADDHEFWNDYPHHQFWLPWTQPSGGAAYAAAFASFQAALNIDPDAAIDTGADVARLLANEARSFIIDDGPVPICMLDARTQRTHTEASDPHFTDPKSMELVLAWLAALQGPGILCVGQPLVATETFEGGDHQLSAYRKDFAALWSAMMRAKHDVLILTGDIHYCRHTQVHAHGDDQHLIREIAVSPLCGIQDHPVDAALGFLTDWAGKGPGHGTLTWDGGQADWFLQSFIEGEKLYATVTLRPLGAVRSDGVDVTVEYWAPPDTAGRPAVKKNFSAFRMR